MMSTSSPVWPNDIVSTTIPFGDNDRNSTSSVRPNTESSATNQLWSNSTETTSIWKDMTNEFGNITLNNVAQLIWDNITNTTTVTNDNNNTMNDTIDNFLTEWNSSFEANLTIGYGGNNYDDDDDHGVETEIGTISPLAALFRFVTAGVVITVNVLTIVTFCRIRALRTLSNMLTVNLAAADLLVGLLVLMSAITAVYIPDFYTAAYECVFRLCWFCVSCSVSMVTICLQGGERYLFIVHPYRHVDFVTAKVIGVLIALSWTIGLSFGMTPYLFSYHYTADMGCDLYYVLGPNHVVYASNAIFLSTSLPTLVFYSLIARLVLEKRRSVIAVPRPNTSSNSTTSTTSLSGNNPNCRHASLRSKLLALKAPAVVFGVFFCCWAPHMFGYIFHDAGFLIPRTARVWMTNIGLFNSAMNFFVYLSLNRQFREALPFFRASGCCSAPGASRQKSTGGKIKSKETKGRVGPLLACSGKSEPTTSDRVPEVDEVTTARPPYTIPVPSYIATSNDQTAENPATTAAFYSYANPLSASAIGSPTSEEGEIRRKTPYIVPATTAENEAIYSYINPMLASCLDEDTVCDAATKPVTPSDIVQNSL